MADKQTVTTDKPEWASKTLWVNAVALVVSVAAAFGFDLGLDSGSQTALVGGIMAVVNMALRFGRSQPLKRGKKPDEVAP